MHSHAADVSLEAEVLAPLAKERAVLLTTFRRDGSPVATPVNLAVEGDHAYFRTYDAAGKAKRLRRNPTVEFAASTMRGKITGPPHMGRAELAQGDEAKHAAELIDRKHRILQGVLVPAYHRLRGYQTLHFRLTPTQ